MRTTEFWIALALIVCLALPGCASTNAPQQTVSATQLVAAHSAPSAVVRNVYCDVYGQADLAKKAGYVQYAVSVTNPIGGPIEGLRENDFAASDGGKPVPIVYFDGNPEPTPVSLAIVVDTSGSMNPKITALRQTLGDLLSGLNSCDEVSLVSFSDHPHVLQDPTTDHELVKIRLGELKPYGQTALHDALSQALQILDTAHYANRAILLFTDGMDNASQKSLSDILATEENRRVPIYAIGIGDPTARGDISLAVGPFTLPGGAADRVDSTALDRLTKFGGGRAWIVPSVNDDDGKTFADAVAGVGKALTGGYVVGLVIPAGSMTNAAPRFSIVNDHRAVVSATRETLSSAPLPRSADPKAQTTSRTM